MPRNNCFSHTLFSAPVFDLFLHHFGPAQCLPNSCCASVSIRCNCRRSCWTIISARHTHCRGCITHRESVTAMAVVAMATVMARMVASMEAAMERTAAVATHLRRHQKTAPPHRPHPHHRPTQLPLLLQPYARSHARRRGTQTDCTAPICCGTF